MQDSTANANLIEWDWLKRWAVYSPNAIAIHDANSGESWSYRDLHELTNRFSELLMTEHGIGFGDRVAILAKNHMAFVPLFFALQRLGAALVPVNYRLTAREITHILGDSQPSLTLVSQEYQGLMREIPSHHLGSLRPWDGREGFIEQARRTAAVAREMPGDGQTLAMILYTSGTTGAPKGAMIHREMLFWNSVNTTLRLDLSQRDIHLSFAPFFHTGGWNVLLTPFLHRGAKTILLERFEVEKILQLIETERVTILFGVPTMLDMLARSPKFSFADLSSLRFAIVGGEPMPLDLIQVWHKRHVPIRQGYGLTEFGPNVFSLNAEDSERKMGSIGFPNFYIEAEVVDDLGHEVAANEIGELILKGPMCMRGYFNHPEATAETIRQGWLHTGDLVRRDSEGYFFVAGRKKDMFISGGENVYPAEIEQVLRLHPAVLEAAVVGVKDEKWGEVGRAFVVKKSDLSAQDLLAHCQGLLARFKIPKHFEFLPELPKSDSGKILKRALPTGAPQEPRL